jgi:peptidoglycan/xylan/chitin deacetylase (PgdA/CDA1 family)
MSVALSLLLAGSFLVLDGPSVTKFAQGKPSAFSLEFDDSMTSQVKNLLPLLAKFHFPATFYVNPGSGQYQANKDVWEKQIPAAGHELGDHTMHHKDTIGAEKASSEIGDAAKLIAKAIGHPMLTPFAIPGGVKWQIPEADFQRILKENQLFFPGREDFYQDGHGDITKFPQRAITEKSWRKLAFHGVGGEWLSTSVETMTTLFQYLDSHRNDLWIAPTGTIWKYERERDALIKVTLGPSGRLAPIFDRTKLEPFELFTVPLTMRSPVPLNWTKAVVTIDGKRTDVKVINSAVEFEFMPQAKSIRVTQK